MSNLIDLSIYQLQELQDFRDSNDYPGAYVYLRDIVQLQMAHADGYRKRDLSTCDLDLGLTLWSASS